MQYIVTCYTTRKTNKIELYVLILANLTSIVLSKESNWQKKRCSMEPYMAGRWGLCKYICDLQLSLYIY